MSRRGPILCRCIHPQNEHVHGVGPCRCGCPAFRLRGRGPTLEVLGLVDPGIRAKRAPVWRVRCPECLRAYETRSYLRELVTRRRCRRCADGLRLVARLTRKKPRAERPADMPGLERFADREHGTRLRYMSGCKCGACREANSAYARMRAKLGRDGQGNPLVDASAARRHLERLSRKGIGRGTVADISRVASSLLTEIRSGRKRRCRAQTAARILAVSAAAVSDGHRVDAAPTWKRIRWLLRQGFTRGAIALRLGMKTPALRIGKTRVNARTAQKVERLYRAMQGALP